MTTNIGVRFANPLPVEIPIQRVERLLKSGPLPVRLTVWSGHNQWRVMKKKILIFIAFLTGVAALAGCQPKADSNTPLATNGPAVMVLTNSTNTNSPGGTNQ